MLSPASASCWRLQDDTELLRVFTAWFTSSVRDTSCSCALSRTQTHGRVCNTEMVLCESEQMDVKSVHTPPATEMMERNSEQLSCTRSYKSSCRTVNIMFPQITFPIISTLTHSAAAALHLLFKCVWLWEDIKITLQLLVQTSAPWERSRDRSQWRRKKGSSLWSVSGGGEEEEKERSSESSCRATDLSDFSFPLTPRSAEVQSFRCMKSCADYSQRETAHFSSVSGAGSHFRTVERPEEVTASFITSAWTPLSTGARGEPRCGGRDGREA